MTVKMADGDEDKSDKKDIGADDLPQNNGIEEEMEDEVEEISDVDSIVEDCSKEYQALDQTIDHLNSVLNSMEEKNDDLYARALALIQENKAVHEELLEENKSTNKPNDGNPS